MSDVKITVGGAIEDAAARRFSSLGIAPSGVMSFASTISPLKVGIPWPAC